METFNSGRLSIARRRRGFTKTRLAQEVGVTARMISAYESGEYVPSPSTLEHLSSSLRFPITFFEGDDLQEPPIDGTSFRALTRMTARQRDQALGSGALALTLDQWINKCFVLPDPAVPRYQGVDPETAAAGIRSEWALGERTIRNMIHLLEAQGVRVYSLPEECASIDAFSFWMDETPYILLNTRKSTEHSRMDAAHELGHLVMHWRGTARGRDAEYEAMRFGSAFLMPPGSLVASAPVAGTLPQIVAAKRMWGVSAAALAYRMRHLERPLLTEWRYRTLFIEMSRKGYLKREPDGIKPETSQILAKVFQSLREDRISKADLADTLRISVADLNEVIFGLTLTPIAGEKPTAAPNPNQQAQLRLVRTSSSTVHE